MPSSSRCCAVVVTRGDGRVVVVITSSSVDAVFPVTGDRTDDVPCQVVVGHGACVVVVNIVIAHGSDGAVHNV